MSFVFDTMGTTVSVATPVPLEEAAGTEVRRVFRAYDERFSLYRPESEGSALASGELAPEDGSPELREAYDLAGWWSRATHGAFTPRRPDGVVDLSGVVKALAIQAAAEALRQHGLDHWCVNAGGDVLVTGTNGGAPWVVGVVDPDDRQALLTQFTCTAALAAVATSGTAERGEHVWRQPSRPAGPPAQAAPAVPATQDFRQVTVAGPDIVTADVLATAILAGGRRRLDQFLTRWPVEVLAAGTDGELVATAGFRAVSPGR